MKNPEKNKNFLFYRDEQAYEKILNNIENLTDFKIYTIKDEKSILKQNQYPEFFKDYPEEFKEFFNHPQERDNRQKHNFILILFQKTEKIILGFHKELKFPDEYSSKDLYQTKIFSEKIDNDIKKLILPSPSHITSIEFIKSFFNYLKDPKRLTLAQNIGVSALYHQNNPIQIENLKDICFGFYKTGQKKYCLSYISFDKNKDVLKEKRINDCFKNNRELEYLLKKISMFKDPQNQHKTWTVPYYINKNNEIKNIQTQISIKLHYHELMKYIDFIKLPTEEKIQILLKTI